MRRGGRKGVTTITDRQRRRRRRLSGAPRERMRRHSFSHPTRDPFFSPPTSLMREFLSFFVSSPLLPSLSLSLSLPPAAEVQQPCIRGDVLPTSASHPRGFRSIVGISRHLELSTAWVKLRKISVRN